MFFLEDSRRQRLGIIFVTHWDGLLKNDGAAIKRSSNEVDGHS